MALATGFVLVLCQAVLIRSFLLNGTASTRITSYEFQLLSKLNLDEQSRITRLEDDVRALFKDQQALKDSKAALEIQLNITNSENISIRQKLNATEVTLGGQTKILKNVKAELDKEIANRHQLQVAYSTLTSNFHNLSVFVNSNTDDIGRLSDKTGLQSAFTVTGFQKDIPQNATNTVIFPVAKSNFGGHYNVNSGKFTCVYNGVYFFLVNLYFKNADIPYCWIRKNGIIHVEAWAHPTAPQNGHFTESTASVLLHLARGETVDVGHCGSDSGVGVIDDKSTFSGVLLHAD